MPALPTVAELAALVAGTVVPAGPVDPAGDPASEFVSGIAPLADAIPGQITHLSSAAYLNALPQTRASAVLLGKAHAELCPVTAIVVDNPYWAYARITQLFEPPDSARQGVAASAVVAPDVQLGASVSIAAGVVIGAGTLVGDSVAIHANAVIGSDCVLGAGTVVHPGVVLHDRVQLGEGCSIHPNAVVGAEGFGFAPDNKGQLERIAQLGSVVLGRNVSVGAGSTIDRGALGDTQIGDGVKIDNQVQIGHNCIIGNHSVICGCCGIVGSTKIGAHCVLGGGVGVGGDGPITLCDGVTVSGMTHVSRSIDQPGVYSGGVLHAESRRWKRNAVRFGELDTLAKRVRALEKQLEKAPAGSDPESS